MTDTCGYADGNCPNPAEFTWVDLDPGVPVPAAQLAGEFPPDDIRFCGDHVYEEVVLGALDNHNYVILIRLKQARREDWP
jgi:hypothetical protein